MSTAGVLAKRKGGGRKGIGVGFARSPHIPFVFIIRRGERGSPWLINLNLSCALPTFQAVEPISWVNPFLLFFPPLKSASFKAIRPIVRTAKVHTAQHKKGGRERNGTGL